MKYFRDIFSLLSCILIFGLPHASSRKYDIESEAQKLYGEDLQSVLKRFRKTPEYLAILEEKFEEMKENLEYIAQNLHAYYEDKLDEKIEDVLGINRTEVDDAKRRRMSVNLPLVDPGPHWKIFRSFQMGISRKRGPLRQSDEPVSGKRNISGVERLDSYWMLRTALSIEERNKFKDVGFEYAGHVIHGLINAAADDESLQQSTLSPYGYDDQESHTTHQHQVTHESTVMDENPTMETRGHNHALHTQPPEHGHTNNILSYQKQ